MCYIGARNIWYANQDINAAIKDYDGNLKERLKNMKCRLEGQKID